jgi:hypothetical protein
VRKVFMNEEPKSQEDERGTEPPAEEGRDKAPQERDAPSGAEEEGSPGPQGNPASDEEALSHRQQEQDPSSDD